MARTGALHLHGTLLILLFSVAPAEAMDLSSLKKESTNIEDRRKEKPPRILNRSLMLSAGPAQERERLAASRKALLSLGKRARLFAFPFSCPVLKDFRSRFVSLGQELKNTSEPERIGLAPSETESAVLERILNPASGKRPDACYGADSAEPVRREMRRTALEREKFLASFSKSGPHAENLFFAIALADDSIQKDNGRKRVTDFMSRLMPDCEQALREATGSLSQYADAYYKLGQFFRSDFESLQSCLDRISGEESREEIVPPPLEGDEHKEGPAG